MRHIRTCWQQWICCLGLLACCGFSNTLLADILSPQNAPRQAEQKPTPLQNVEIHEHLGDAIPLDLKFINELGQSVTLKQYFQQGRPVILTLAYYECPMLCTMVLNGVGEAVQVLDWLPGKEFQMLTVSIDPREQASLAAAKKQSHYEQMGKKIDDQAWTFLVGEEASSKALADALGFNYYYDKSIQQYAHAAAAFVLTADGKISRYLYGIQFKPKDLKLALVEAGEGKIGTSFDRLLLYCYAYDPNSRGYVLVAMNVMRLGGGMAVLLLGVLLGFWWYREKQRMA